MTDNGFKDASSDHAVVCKWWTRWPRAYVGVPTGHRFVVVDIDLQYPEAQAWLEANSAHLPQTRTHITKSGGRHLLFRSPAGIGCSAGRLGPHVDTRGLGGYVVWWPASGFEVQHGDILAEVPEWIVAALATAAPTDNLPAGNDPFADYASSVVPQTSLAPPDPDQSQRRLTGIIRAIANVNVGERNHVTFWGACRLAEMVAEQALSRDEAIALTIEAASRAGLSRYEAQRTAQSALK